MKLWYTEKHSKDARFSIKVERQWVSQQSEFQKIDVMESQEFWTVPYLGRSDDADRER